jgi:tetratricopeptide (TPR) repeat protein
MLNRALRTFEVDTIVKMGFFIHDLHQHIKRLYLEQFGGQNVELLTVYRGQGLLTTDFEKLMNTKGGLMSFNNFLSTSADRDIAFAFAESNGSNVNMIGILFEITIDSLASTAVFASLDDVSYYKKNEKEILFSMHTVFRICDIKKIDDNPWLWCVKLKLTNDNDEQLNAITKRMRSEICGTTGWHRLGELFIRLSEFDMAETLCRTLLDRATNDSEKLELYDQLGRIMDCKGNRTEALSFYEKQLHIDEIRLHPYHPNLANTYHNIALVYSEMGEYSKALSFNEKSLEIKQEVLPPNHPFLGYSYHNIGLTYSNMNEYLKALSFYEIAVEIWHKSLPSNHPDLANTYNNIGCLYTEMGEYSKALPFHQKAFEIRQNTLPENHPDLATSYENIGAGYSKVGEYSKALYVYEKLLQIQQKTLPSNHLSLADTYNTIGLMYDNIGEYWKALLFLEKALQIREKSLPPNDPVLSNSYHNIGNVYYSMGERSKAVVFFERSINIAKRLLPPNNPLCQEWEKFQKDMKKL